MQSENIHIDEFFRKKEEEWTPDNERQNAHWQQMESMLVHPATVTPGKRVKVRTSRRISRYLGGFAVITIITIITYTATKIKKAVTTKSATAKTAVQKSNPATVKRPQKNDAPAVVAKIFLPAVITKNSPKPVQHNNRSVIKVDGSTEAAKKEEVTVVPASTAKPTPDAAALLNDFYKSFEKAGQEFFVQAARDTMLTANEGTRLLIPAHAFVNQSGKVKTGIVKIVLTEYYKYDDIAAAKLSTTSNGEQLVTGGMLNIKAVADGEELKLAPQKNIELAMPTNNYDKRMQLFTESTSKPILTLTLKKPQRDIAYYSDTIYNSTVSTAVSPGINWVPASNESGIFADNSARDLINVFDLSVDPQWVTYGKNTTAKFYVRKGIEMSNEEIREELKKRYGTYYDKIKIRRVGKRGRSLSVIDSIAMDFNTAVRLKLVSKEDSIRRRAEFEAKIKAAFGTNDKKDKSDLTYYRFRTTRLGWINCDRYARYNNNVMFTINLGEGYEADKFISQLVFTRSYSIMSGYYEGSRIQFRSVPENEPVQLISVGVKDGKIVSCIQSFKATRQEITNLKFEETTPEQFRKKLESLNFVQ